jgi:hypothetical protein
MRPDLSTRTIRLAIDTAETSPRSATALHAAASRRTRIRDGEGPDPQATRFPARNSLKEFDFDHARSLRPEVIGSSARLSPYELFASVKPGYSGLFR